jgi:hypothetical protein
VKRAQCPRQKAPAVFIVSTHCQVNYLLPETGKIRLIVGQVAVHGKLRLGCGDITIPAAHSFSYHAVALIVLIQLYSFKHSADTLLINHPDTIEHDKIDTMTGHLVKSTGRKHYGKYHKKTLLEMVEKIDSLNQIYRGM